MTALRADVSALYVDPRGPYPSLVSDWWDEKRDARLYAGPNPVVAHPPCQRWGRYWSGGPMLARTPRAKALGDDGGCFASAIAAVRAWGGVLEHPEASHAWRAFGLLAPPKCGGWVAAGDWLGWTCCVEQGMYGHRSRKATWLYVVGAEPPRLLWGKSGKIHRLARLDDGYHSREERRRAQKRGTLSRLSKFQRIETPLPFAEVLVGIAASAKPVARSA